MDLLRMVVKKRSEDDAKQQDTQSLGRFATRVAKLKGEGPMATSEEPEVALEVISINLTDIEVPPSYLRKSVGNVVNLIESIKVFGIQQPLKVVKIRGSKKYRLVFGYRRMKAAEKIGLDAVPCIVELVAQENRLMMLSLAENVCRCDFSPLEEGGGYRQLVKQSYEMDELCKQLAKPAGEVKTTMDFLTLPESVRKEILNDPQKFSWGILNTLLIAFRNSKVHGKKLFQAIAAGKVRTDAEAEAFMREL